jgi:peptidoglycan hydrolase CwlO-like protein
MIQGLIVKKVMEVVMKQLMKQFKLDKIQEYVEQPNELDKQVKSLKKSVNKYGKYIEEIEKDLAIVKDSLKKFKKLKF